MNSISFSNVVLSSLEDLWLDVAGFLPELVGAIVVLVIGLLVAAGLGVVVERLFRAIKLDDLLERSGVGPYFERADIKLRGSWFLGRLVYWFLVVAFLLAAAEILRLFTLSSFLRDVLLYIPNVVAAVLIMLAAVLIAGFARKLISGSVRSAKLAGADFLGTLTWWAITLFGFFAALSQLGIAEVIVNALVMGFIAMLALAGGLAFGLGGREYAAHLISRLREHTEGNRRR